MRLPLRALATVVLMASGTRLRAPEPPDESTAVQIYLLADALHTGMVFELRWLVESGFLKPAEIGDHRFVAMSWGDETAYVQERWLTPLQVYRALFTRTPSVMECIPFDWKVEEVCPHQRVYVAEVPVSAGPDLAGFLNGHIARSPDGAPVTVAPSSWGNGRLIRCPPHLPYHLSRMCNNWTAEALAAAGLTIDPDQVLTAWDVIRPATSESNGFRLMRNPATARGTAAGPPRPSDRGSCR